MRKALAIILTPIACILAPVVFASVLMVAYAKTIHDIISKAIESKPVE